MFRLFALLTLVFGLWVVPATATGGVIGALNTNTTEEPAPTPPGPPMPPQGQYQTLPIMIDCGRYEDVVSIIIKAGEQPLAAGKILFKIPDGRAIEAILEMWANPETRTFTSVLRVTDEYACLVFPGKEFMGAPQQGLTL
jgi:hypothetical protein